RAAGARDAAPGAARPGRRPLPRRRRAARRLHARLGRLRPDPRRRPRLGARAVPGLDRLPADPVRPPGGRVTRQVQAAFWGGRPFAWVGFAVALLAIPLIGFAVESGRPIAELLPAVNACLNATSAIFLFAGWRAIRADRVDLHWRCMLCATGASAVFLTCYL